MQPLSENLDDCRRLRQARALIDSTPSDVEAVYWSFAAITVHRGDIRT
jgi:hypothetical protein